MDQLVPLSEAEVTHLCTNVTPKIRDFCCTHMAPDFPEDFVRGTCKTPAEDLTAAPPFTEEQWWGFINERIVSPDPDLTGSEAQ